MKRSRTSAFVGRYENLSCVCQPREAEKGAPRYQQRQRRRSRRHTTVRAGSRLGAGRKSCLFFPMLFHVDVVGWLAARLLSNFTQSYSGATEPCQVERLYRVTKGKMWSNFRSHVLTAPTTAIWSHVGFAAEQNRLYSFGRWMIFG